MFAEILTRLRVPMMLSGAWAVLMVPQNALPQSFPGNAPPELVGDWECGSAEIYLSRLASIEILDDDYVAGLFDAADGRFEIEWDEGGRATWSYRLAPDGTLTLGDPDGPSWTCLPRE